MKSMTYLMPLHVLSHVKPHCNGCLELPWLNWVSVPWTSIWWTPTWKVSSAPSSIFLHFVMSCASLACFKVLMAGSEFATLSRICKIVSKSLLSTNFSTYFIHQLDIRAHSRKLSKSLAKWTLMSSSVFPFSEVVMAVVRLHVRSAMARQSALFTCTFCTWCGTDG